MELQPRTPPPYLTAALTAQAALQQSMWDAADLLPSEIEQRHWIAGHHSPSAWRSAEAWYRNQDPCDPHILSVLTDLALMSEALSCLFSVTTPRDVNAAPDLSLKKHKRINY